MLIKVVLFDLFDTLMLIERNHEFYSPSLMRMYKYLNKKGIDVSFDVFNQAYLEVRDELYTKADPNLEEPHFNVRVANTLQSLGYNYTVSSPIVAEASAEFCMEFMTFVTLDPEAKKMLHSLHGKYKLGIVSNFAIPECVQTLLQKYGLEGLFDVVVVSAAVNKRKPSPEIFEKTLKALGVSAGEAVFVGDTVDADIAGAKAVGMRAVYVERRFQKESENVRADVTIKSLSELLSVLEQL
jgi:HAD superfamily hydrolase (TIGR01662 family)